MVVLRKNIAVERGQSGLFEEYRYFFYITNVKGLSALHSPVDTLVSNWVDMVMASLAWSLKAWYALMLPVTGRWRGKHEAEKAAVLKMEFLTFLNEFIRIPAQVVKTGHRIIFRLLGWGRWQHVFLRGLVTIRGPALS